MTRKRKSPIGLELNLVAGGPREESLVVWLEFSRLGVLTAVEWGGNLFQIGCSFVDFPKRLNWIDCKAARTPVRLIASRGLLKLVKCNVRTVKRVVAFSRAKLFHCSARRLGSKKRNATNVNFIIRVFCV